MEIEWACTVMLLIDSVTIVTLYVCRPDRDERSPRRQQCQLTSSRRRRQRELQSNKQVAAE